MGFAEWLVWPDAVVDVERGVKEFALPILLWAHHGMTYGNK